MSPRQSITIGSRGSDLALWQARFIRDQLQAIGVVAAIKIITTTGDQIQNIGFDKMEGKGFFTKEIEEALKSGEIDLAVHSHKDLETEMPEGLCIAAVSERADPRDLLLANKACLSPDGPLGLRPDLRIGTSSSRRKAQIKHVLPAATVSDLRGNVPTRIAKLRDGMYDAIILAKAGTDRLQLNLSDLFALPLDVSLFTPPPAQGVLAVQARISDSDLVRQLSAIDHPDVSEAIGAERRLLKAIGGGCQLPLGAYCRREGQSWVMEVAYATAHDQPLMRFTARGAKADHLAHQVLLEITKALR